MKNYKYLTVGQFASLNKINKRTLHYYDEIDLLKPKIVGDNGYRYYTYIQSIDLEVILIMRKLGLSIEEIQQYKKYRNVDNLEKIFNEQINLIEDKITSLEHTKNFLNVKLEQLRKGKDIVDGEIDIITIPDETILVSEVMEDDSDDAYFKLMAEFTSELKEERDIYNNFGSRISVQNIYEDKLLSYDRFFVRCEEKCDKITSEVKKGGRYVRAYCKGGWKRIMDMYRTLVKYAQDNGFEYEGYGYEEGVNELASQEIADFTTKITIKIKDK